MYTGDFDLSQTKTVIEDDLHRVACPVTADRLIVSRMNTPALVGMAGYSANDAPNVYLPDRLWQVSFVGIDPQFVHRWTQTSVYRDQVTVVTAGTSSSMHNLSQDDFKAFVLDVPPAQEQLSIVRFLDAETTKIDVLIEKQERLIETLAERRQAVISHAVTKGIDPNAPARDSGVEWLGSISAKWSVLSLNRLLRSPLKYGANEAAVHDDPEWPRYIRITDFGSDGVLRADTFRSLPPEIAREYPLEGGDILLARSGATAGKSFLVPDDVQPSCYAGYLIRVALNSNRAVPHFLSYFLASSPYAKWRALSVIQATIENISAEKYARMVVPVPPIEEQQEIIRHLDVLTQRIDALSAKAREMIDVLKERRQALISAAVTGKIDVRGLS
ncbi:type I restriction endonuclease [Cryobacterium sp. LW097]|nr:type I restriction endonuclease [Cryobacterium sp. LW097]